jgi:spore maturation protein CgeB
MFFAHSWGARVHETNAHWLPIGYDPEAHTDLGIERDVEVGMMGVIYQNRIDILNAMAGAGLNVQAGMGLLWDDYNAFYNRCKIALVRSIDGDLTQRFFENMAQGCCVLADRPRDAEKAGFVAGVDYWTYDGTPEGATREAKFLLDSGQWQVIARNGQRKVNGHTWDKRLQTLFDICL